MSPTIKTPVIASAAKQSIFSATPRKMDCFAALAMTMLVPAKFPQ
jgi:hypothetical protein